MNAPRAHPGTAADDPRNAAPYYESTRGLAELWFGVTAGPAAWFLHLNASYSLVVYICASGNDWVIHAATVASLLLAGAGVLVAWRSWRRIGTPEITAGPGSVGRTRFMALGGLGLSAFFLLIIVMAWIPDFVLSPCGGGL